MSYAVAKPFSLQCLDCDAGQDVASKEQATKEGWIEVEPIDPDEIEETYFSWTGRCPDCKPKENQPELFA